MTTKTLTWIPEKNGESGQYTTKTEKETRTMKVFRLEGRPKCIKEIETVNGKDTVTYYHCGRIEPTKFEQTFRESLS